MRPGYSQHSGIKLSSHVEQRLTLVQSADAIATHFSSISQEFEPLSLQKLPPNVCSYLTDRKSIPPTLSPEEVYLRLIKAKKPNSQVPGDLRPRLVKSFPHLLADPVSRIFNSILSTSEYPSSWKTEYQVPIAKIDNPENEDHLRK